MEDERWVNPLIIIIIVLNSLTFVPKCTSHHETGPSQAKPIKRSIATPKRVVNDPHDTRSLYRSMFVFLWLYGWDFCSFFLSFLKSWSTGERTSTKERWIGWWVGGTWGGGRGQVRAANQSAQRRPPDSQSENRHHMGPTSSENPRPRQSHAMLFKWDLFSRQ